MFIHGMAKITGAAVIGLLRFPEAMDETERATHNLLKHFILSAEEDTLSQFIVFASGASCLPNFGLGKIQVKFSSVASVFASTCLHQKVFFSSKDDFASAMIAVLKGELNPKYDVFLINYK